METVIRQALLLPLRQIPSPPPLSSSRVAANSMYRQNKKKMGTGRALILCCSDSSSISSSYSPSPAISTTSAPPVKRRRKRYRRLYPGESKGITEEMRFVAMRLRRVNKGSSDDDDQDSSSEDGKEREGNLASDASDDDGGVGGATWEPTLDGYLKYLVDSKLVFDTVERIVDESSDVAYAYFRKTGLERSEGLAKDLEWIRLQGFVIPEPNNPGVSYAKYLNELAEKSAPLFLCHFYNIYFSHIAGGQVIARQVSKKLLEGREMEFYRWEGDMAGLMSGVREKLNMLGEHWSRDEKNKCLKEATKSFRFLGQIVRLIIL